MSFTRIILGNRHAIWALTLAAAALGALAYTKLPMQLFPDTAPPIVNVLTRYPGAAADEVARDLSFELEKEFASLEGIHRIRTSSQDSLSLVSLEFQYDRSVELAAVDVQNAVAKIRGLLPPSILEPQVLKFSTNDRPVVTVGVRTEDLRQARRVSEDVIAPRLQRIPGVAAVDVFGGAVDAVLVDLDPLRLEAYRIPFPRVVEELRIQNATLPAGSIETARSKTSLRVEARARDVAALAALRITAGDGSRHRLDDLGVVHRAALDDDARFAIGGERQIAVQVFKTTDANTVEVVGAVERALDELRARSPDVDLVVGEESASFTKLSVSNLIESVWQALLLASVIIFFFVGRLRSSLVVAFSMPLSFGIAFSLMYAVGVELNMVTLSAVILAVGMVVDATVVVMENIERRRSVDRLGPEDAAAEGTDEVRLAVAAGAGTTIIVLVPLLFLEGFIGKTFGPLALTLLFAFVSSITVALVLIPVLSLYTAGSGRLDRLGERITAPFRSSMDWVRDRTIQLLGLALRHRAAAVLVALALFAVGLFAIRQRGMDVLPPMDGGSFFVSVETPSGSSLEETERVVREVETLLAREDEVILFQSQVGFEAGMRSVGASGVQGPTQGMITVMLTPRTQRDESIWSIQQRVRDGVAKIPGIQAATVKELGNTAKATTAAPVVIRLSGDDPLVLDALGDRVLEVLRSIPGLVELHRSWRLDQRRLRVDVDERRAAELGLSPAAIAQQMQLGSVGAQAGSFYPESSSSIPIVTRLRPRGDSGDPLSYPMPVAGSPELVRLAQVATARATTGAGLVTSEDFARTLDLSAQIRGRPLSFVTAELSAALDSVTVPGDYLLELVGETDDLQDARGQLLGAISLSVVAVYLLLVAQMRSFLHPFTVLLSVPLSLSGVGASLWLTGKSVSMPVMIALVLLVGTVVNNAIILIDFIRTAREQGSPRREALLDSVRLRFRPIMMTSLSTIVGMLPLAAESALGVERFSPLAIAVVGGMTAATLLTLIVIPVLYDTFDAAQEALTLRPDPTAGAATDRTSAA